MTAPAWGIASGTRHAPRATMDLPTRALHAPAAVSVEIDRAIAATPSLDAAAALLGASLLDLYQSLILIDRWLAGERDWAGHMSAGKNG